MSGVKEQQALNDYLESLDPKKLLREFQKEKEREEKRREDEERRQRKEEKEKYKLQRKEEKEKKKKLANEERQDLSGSTGSSKASRNTSPESEKSEEKKPTRTEMPLSKSIIPVLLYNTEICTAAISCYISEGKHHALADAILDLFSANRVEQKLIVHCLQCELDSNHQQSSLFRDNTPGTALLAAYCKKKGQPLMKDLLQPFFQEVLALPLALELDDNRCTSEEAAQNVPLLADLVERILSELYHMVDKLPSSLRSIFQYLQHNVLLKYPDMNTRIIGGFFFLRFFCPMIVAPERYQITKRSVPASGRRTLVLVTKVIQNISNRIEFGKGTESYMLPMNDLVKKHIPLTAEFLAEIANPPEDGSYYLPKADTKKPDGEVHSIQPDQLHLIVSKIAEIPNKMIAYLPNEESVQQFRNFHNKILRDVHEVDPIGWVPFEIPKEEPVPEADVDFDGMSRSAFLLMREALAQCEDELKEMRHKLEEERILRQSMQHIIINIADTIHFQIDERVRMHVENITKRAADPTVGEGFCELLARRSTVQLERPPLPLSAVPDIPIRQNARSGANQESHQSFAPIKPLPAAPNRAPRPNSLGAPIQETKPTPPEKHSRPDGLASPVPPPKPSRPEPQNTPVLVASPQPKNLGRSRSPGPPPPRRPSHSRSDSNPADINRSLSPRSQASGPSSPTECSPSPVSTNKPRPQETPKAFKSRPVSGGDPRILKPLPAGRGKPRLSPSGNPPPPLGKTTSSPHAGARGGRPLPRIPS